MALSLLTDFVELVFPNVCASCGNNLYDHERVVCAECLYYLPRTNFHRNLNEKVSEIFFGRFLIEYATAFVYFQKDSKFQQLIYLLKYKSRIDIGEELGRLFGNDLAESGVFDSVDLIIPVPLHPKKMKLRGYNQSEAIAKGLCESMNKMLNIDVLQRCTFTETQTKKDKASRWDNVKEAFEIKNSEKIQDCHILLVDDVITTGATLEACATKILEVANTKVSIASLAIAT